MRPLDLDYQRTGSRSPWAAWVLLAVAVAFATDLGLSYATVRSQLAAREAQLVKLSPERPAVATASKRQVDIADLQRELVAAQGIINRLAIPWNDLFNALEAANTENVSLLTVEPEPDSGILLLTGEAKNFPALLTYIARLENNKFFGKVGLTKHEIRRDEPQRPLFFSVSAAWKVKP
jgi:hypothetical protein